MPDLMINWAALFSRQFYFLWRLTENSEMVPLFSVKIYGK